MGEIDESNEIKDNRKNVLKAKLMTILPEYNDKARELLERVVKRDPTDFEGIAFLAFELVVRRNFRQNG